MTDALPTMTDALPTMVEALGLEIAAIRRKGGGTQIELRGGERVGQAEGSWLYRFLIVEDLNLRDDTPVRVTGGQEDVSGVLVSFRDGVLVLALDADLGPTIAAARLVTNDSFLIERLVERLEKVRCGEAKFNSASANRVLGLAPPKSADAEPAPAIWTGHELNASQIAAVRRSLGSDVTYVWGPPGTGKTTTVARVVEAHFRAGRSVLLVSNTNIAVDTALERVAERLKGDPEFHEGLVIRQGPVVKEELSLKFGPQVILEQIVARLGQALRDEKEQLSRDLRTLEAEERSLALALKELQQLAQTQQKVGGLLGDFANMRATAAARGREAREHRVRGSKLRSDLERARSMGSVRRFLSGLNPERLSHDIATEDRAAQAAQDAEKALKADIVRLEAELGSLREEVERLLASTSRNPLAPELEASLNAVRTRLVTIRDRIAAIERELATIEQQVLARCRILATTVYRTYLGNAAPRQFDTVVIDEASMLMPPLVYYASGLATTSVTVVGDFRQLPPIVMSEEPLAGEWLKRDVFEKAAIPQAIERGALVPHLVHLGTQYRMREPICAVINSLFYPDHPLISDPSVGCEDSRFPLSRSELLYVDTAPFHPWTSLRVGTYSRYNLFHALVVRNIVLHLAEVGYLPGAGDANQAVGVVAPYSSQAKLIQALLEDRLGNRAAGLAATVHRFQGNEKAVMILDLTDSLGAPLSRFLKAVRMGEDGTRLLNVAVSRAQHHVLLVGNFDYLRSKAPEGAVVRRLLDRFEDQGEKLELESLLPLSERDWIDGLHRVFPDSFEFPETASGAFTEGTFYPAFRRDLAGTQKSVVIFSPFATSVGTGRWADALRTALARGTQVRILTRPPEELGGGTPDEVTELIRGLRGLGVTVELRSRMHEKIAILDSRILWHGSLNILSHRDTRESMLRIVSPAACSLFARFISTPAGRRDDAAPLHSRENPECPKCSGPTVWNNGRYGLYFKCEKRDCDGKVDPRRTRRNPTAATARHTRGRQGRAHTAPAGPQATKPCPKPDCGGRLVEREGRHGRFLGCSNYPRCRHTDNLS